MDFKTLFKTSSITLIFTCFVKTNTLLSNFNYFSGFRTLQSKVFYLLRP